MIAGLADLVQGLCERQPVLLIAEDIHRADPSSSELLVHLVSQVKSRLLILSTSLEAPISDKERESESIRLAPLDVTQAKALVRSVAEGEVDDACMERIVDLAAGVPFFLIEMARGNCEGASPSCIQAILQVRLDKLGADKRVAQMASVFGLCVEPDSLSILCDLSVEKLGESLRTLLATAILQWDDDGRLVFQNASLRDAVYFSLMEEDRRKAHCRAAQLLSKQSTDKALVAYHFEMAREWEKAARWWLDAGEHDVLLHANREALDHFSAGIASAERMPEGVVRDKLLQQLHSRQKSCSGILPESQRSTCFQALS
jgi:predicted ATPase